MPAAQTAVVVPLAVVGVVADPSVIFVVAETIVVVALNAFFIEQYLVLSIAVL